MERKVLHMIGNSHIDPVWFWRWQEGMQEVRATLASALDRMKEFPEFKYTATSAAFFAYLEAVDPDLLDEIRQRVEEGRFELTGGWWIEPDCNLPTGEAFVRQALYGQRTFLRLFGRMARIGSNVDSFGHHPQMPQFLHQSRMEGYIFLRPCAARAAREYTPGRVPVFNWVAPDGTSVPAISLPGEYTTWFYEPTKENIERTLQAIGDLPALPCCYGVGNHGGGPTVANIQAIRQLQQEYPGTELRFSTVGDCFDALAPAMPALPAVSTYFDHVNAGCYSVDHRLKQKIRQAEAALLQAEKLDILAGTLGAPRRKTAFAGLWQRLLFNQFHDTMGGTIIEEAHDDALNDVGGIAHEAGISANLDMQAIMGRLRVPGRGIPIFLFNLTGKPVRQTADVEIDWFCKDPLRLTDHEGREVPYVRAKQSCTMVWTRLGGRRRILFEAALPAFGAAVYYAVPETPSLELPVAHEGDLLTLCNGRVSFRLNAKGEPVSLTDLASGYEALTGPCRFTVWHDDRDPWGSAGRRFEPVDAGLVTDSVDCVESSGIRQVLRVRQHGEGLRLETHYMLYRGERSVRMDCRLVWDRPWHQLRYCIPAGSAAHVSESPYGVMRHEGDDDELFMHRFVDATRPDGRGLAVTADSLCGFQPRGGDTELLILRSPIFAQGADRSLWMHDYDSYHYMDIGDHHFTLTLTPHGQPMPQRWLYELADLHEQGCLYLVGGLKDRRGSRDVPGFRIDHPSVRLGAAKRAEDGEAVILRLHETDGQPAQSGLSFGGQTYSLSFRPYEIKTLRIGPGGAMAETDFLE